MSYSNVNILIIQYFCILFTKFIGIVHCRLREVAETILLFSKVNLFVKNIFRLCFCRKNSAFFVNRVQFEYFCDRKTRLKYSIRTRLLVEQGFFGDAFFFWRQKFDKIHFGKRLIFFVKIYKRKNGPSTPLQSTRTENHEKIIHIFHSTSIRRPKKKHF